MTVEDQVKLTRCPAAPALVRRRMTALMVGVGLGGAGCGGDITGASGDAANESPTAPMDGSAGIDAGAPPDAMVAPDASDASSESVVETSDGAADAATDAVSLVDVVVHARDRWAPPCGVP